VLIYSSASGAYAGINLEGSKISTDDQTIRNLYGPNATLQIILGGQVPPPGPAQSFLSALNGSLPNSSSICRFSFRSMVELTGIEAVASSLRTRQHSITNNSRSAS
jgi:hypothetical protein